MPRAETIAVPFGDVAGDARLKVPGDFSHAVSLVLNVQGDTRALPRTALMNAWFRLLDSLDGENWSTVPNMEGGYSAWVGATSRYVAPLGPELQVEVWVDNSNPSFGPRDQHREITLPNVTATLFVRRFDP